MVADTNVARLGKDREGKMNRTLTIKDLLGHGTIDMTQRYAHLAPNQKRVAVEVLGMDWVSRGDRVAKG